MENNSYKAYVALYQYINEKADYGTKRNNLDSKTKNTYFSDVLAIRIASLSDEEAKDYALNLNNRTYIHPASPLENHPRFLGIKREPELDKFILADETVDFQEFFCIEDNPNETLQLSKEEPKEITFDEAMTYFEKITSNEHLTAENFKQKIYRLYFNFIGSASYRPSSFKYGRDVESGEYDVDNFINDVLVITVLACNERRLDSIIKEITSNETNHYPLVDMKGYPEFLGMEHHPEEEDDSDHMQKPEIIDNYFCKEFIDPDLIECFTSEPDPFTFEEAKDEYQEYQKRLKLKSSKK